MANLTITVDDGTLKRARMRALEEELRHRLVEESPVTLLDLGKPHTLL